jgi:hypothetical protein
MVYMSSKERLALALSQSAWLIGHKGIPLRLLAVGMDCANSEKG